MKKREYQKINDVLQKIILTLLDKPESEEAKIIKENYGKLNAFVKGNLKTDTPDTESFKEPDYSLSELKIQFKTRLDHYELHCSKESMEHGLWTWITQRFIPKPSKGWIDL